MNHGGTEFTEKRSVFMFCGKAAKHKNEKFLRVLRASVVKNSRSYAGKNF
jgi:hypothetical protein